MSEEMYRLQVTIPLDLEVKLKHLAQEDERDLRAYCRRVLKSHVEKFEFEDINIEELVSDIKEQRAEAKKSKSEKKENKTKNEKQPEPIVQEKETKQVYVEEDKKVFNETSKPSTNIVEIKDVVEEVIEDSFNNEDDGEFYINKTKGNKEKVGKLGNTKK